MQAPTSTEVMIKIRHQTSFSLNRIASYISDKDRTNDNESLYDSYGNPIDQKQFDQICDRWTSRNKEDRKKELLAMKKTGKEKQKNTRYGTHLMFSMKEPPSKKNMEALKTALKAVQIKHFTSFGFDSVFVIHQNTNHLHAHLLIHNKNLITGKKIRFSKQADLFTLKSNFAKVLSSLGYDYTTTQKNIDSPEIQNDPSRKRDNRKDYFTNELCKVLGDGVRDFAKKQMIEAKSKDPKKKSRATDNLALLRQYENSKIRAEILKRVKTFQSQQEKFRIKKELSVKHPNIEFNDIGSYVDMVFARRSQLLKAVNTKRPVSVSKLESAEIAYEGLSNADPAKILEFADFQRRKKQCQREVEKFSRFGLPGKELLRLLQKERQSAETQIKQHLRSDLFRFRLEKTEDAIKQLTQGKFSPEQIEREIYKRNAKGQTAFLKAKLDYWRKEIAASATVPEEHVDVNKLFKLYIIRRGNDPKGAYQGFLSSMDHYKSLLKSGNRKKLRQFHYAVDKQLSVTIPTTKLEL